MKQKIYFDTSVFGGYFDIEFAEYTIPLFDRVRNNELQILYSALTEQELEPSPEKVKQLVRSLPADNIDFIDISAEAVTLAKQYIAENVVGKTNYEDCLHIALATIHKADYLASWNFKHIVNTFRIRGYNAVNLKMGYSTLEIRSPRDLMKYED
ncbi:MAG: PIN domain-containing protein [Prevotellaceae bacterium]|jgi:inactivated superfamily I helicase|nr:PIN domain-containing protein [Prevotellaceae bacterium]